MSTPTRDDLRTLPHDLDAEQAVLGAILIGPPHLIDDVKAAGLAAADFYRPAHRIIYEAISDLYDRGEPADVVTVFDELGRRGELARVGGGPYLHTLAAAVPTAANAVHYARIVRAHARMRALVEVGTRIAQYGYEGDPDDADDVIGRAVAALTEQDAGGDAPPAAPDVLWEVMAALEGQATQPRVPLPYADLDRLLGGLTPGQLVVIGARPGVGKTTVALDIARCAALRHGLPAYVASLEMPRQELMLRILSAEARVNLAALREQRTGRAALGDADWQRLGTATSRVSDAAHLVLDDQSDITVDYLRAQMRRMSRGEHAPRLVIVDYLQLMRAPQVGRRAPETRQLELSEISRGLKALAKQADVPIVALSQLNRQVEYRADKRPQLADLRESGAIEQDADVVILLHRDDERPGEMDLIVAKHRNGPTATVTVAWQGHYGRAVDMASEAAS